MGVFSKAAVYAVIIFYSFSLVAADTSYPSPSPDPVPAPSPESDIAKKQHAVESLRKAEKYMRKMQKRAKILGILTMPWLIGILSLKESKKMGKKADEIKKTRKLLEAELTQTGSPSPVPEDDIPSSGDTYLDDLVKRTLKENEEKIKEQGIDPNDDASVDKAAEANKANLPKSQNEVMFPTTVAGLNSDEMSKLRDDLRREDQELAALGYDVNNVAAGDTAIIGGAEGGATATPFYLQPRRETAAALPEHQIPLNELCVRYGEECVGVKSANIFNNVSQRYAQMYAQRQFIMDTPAAKPAVNNKTARARYSSGRKPAGYSSSNRKSPRSYSGYKTKPNQPKRKPYRR